MNLKDDIYRINNEKDFEALALKIFNYQYTNNETYKQWCKLLSITWPKNINEIPFLPIELFKSRKIFSNHSMYEDYFLSSGTTSSERSVHLIFDKEFYIRNTQNCFNQFFKEGVCSYCYIFLLPNYLEQQHSSLICMCDAFIKKSNYKNSGFYKDNLSDVISILKDNERQNIPTILFGVSYALLDLAQIEHLNLKRNTKIFETGGMKGKRKEMPKEELHKILKQAFNVENIYSEYGMCELLSQAYSLNDGIFFTPKQMKVLIKEVNDYKSQPIYNKSGRINIIDLANVDTCSFIQTQDLGIQSENSGFRILGRVDNSSLRGCNLMYEN